MPGTTLCPAMVPNVFSPSGKVEACPTGFRPQVPHPRRMALLLIYPPLLVQEAELRLYDTHAVRPHHSAKIRRPGAGGHRRGKPKSYGQWPWPRYRLARLVKQLHRLGAAVIVLDFLMPEPDRTSPEVIVSERQRDHETDCTLSSTASATGQQFAAAGRLPVPGGNRPRVFLRFHRCR